LRRRYIGVRYQPMPRRQKTPTIAVCANCGQSFETIRPARFCPTDRPGKASRCQQAYANRLALRGKIMAPYVLAWLEGRGGGHTKPHPIAGDAMRELTQIGRDFIEEDREARRPPATSYLESLLADGFRYCDRRKIKR